MDAPCEIQGSIHVFRLVNNMCPGKWVHITPLVLRLFYYIMDELVLHIFFYMNVVFQW